ncbi:MAG: Rpn family recombination-promoting nuclease/putative transposase [Lachnospiraceae bacterium]|nr:Rpn family recombination-promoting nuclease/putative transposase [Lachnospiraceae bacterium]
MANTKLEKLNLLDKFLFDETMEDKEAYQAAIGILLENEVELLEKPVTEKEFRVSPQLREIRLDVIGIDKEKKLYHTEMQQRNTGNLVRRSRYYQAQLDVSLLEPGSKDFNLLNESCFILIAPFDVFGRGLYRYTFEGVCRECQDLKLEDGAVRIFINTKGRNREDFSREFLDFMEYIGKTTDETAERAAGNRIKKIHERVRSVRKSEKAGVKYMQRWEELAYAREDGDLQRVVSLVCKKIKKNKTLEEITDDLEEEVSVIEPIYNTAKEFAPVYDPALVFEQVRSESR